MFARLACLDEGTIVRDSDSIDSATRTLNVEVDVNNAQDRIKTGAYAFVHLKLPQSAHASAQSLTVPANTLLFRSEGLRVGVVRNGHAELTPIKIGRDFGATVEVVAGLHATDQVIVSPSDSLTSGTPVQVTDTSITNWLNWPSRMWAVGPQLSETLFDAGRRRATSESATANYDGTVPSYRQTALTAFQEVEDNLAALRILETEAQQQQQATASAADTLQLFTNRYVGGVDNYLQVITRADGALDESAQ